MIALLIAVTLAAAPRPAPAPPDGTYTYVRLEKGKPVANYVISVRRAGSKIDVKGMLKPDAAQGIGALVESHANVDAATLDLISYHEIEQDGCGAIPIDLVVTGSTARLGGKHVAFPGIAHYLLDDGHSVPFFLPAEVSLWNDARAVSIAPEAGSAHVVEPYPMAVEPERPASVPPNDRYMALHALGAKTNSSGLWYDPQTMIVDEVDTATARWLRKGLP